MLYSFDIFDTIITRKTDKPDDIFKLIEEHLKKENNPLWSFDLRNNFSLIRKDAEYNARAILKKSEVNIDEIYRFLQMETAISDEDREILKQLELFFETENVVPIEENIEILKDKIEAGQRVILISDMYLGESNIRNLLKFDRVFETIPIYVSCDFGCSKRDGNLYIKIREIEKVSYEDWAHMGDNEQSDYEIPKLFGIKSILYKGKSVETKDYAIDLKEKQRCTPYEIGKEVGFPILYAYVRWIIEIALKKNIELLLFMARDGYLPQKIADAYITHKKLPIRTKYIYGSRESLRVETVDQKEIVREYFFQQMEANETNFAIVDLHGTGKTFELLSGILGKEIVAFYYNMFGIPNPLKCNAYMYSRIFSLDIEALGRAPHGKTVSYQKENGKYIPILKGKGENSGEYMEYIRGVLDATKSELIAPRIDNYRKVGNEIFSLILDAMNEREAEFWGDLEGMNATNLNPYTYAPKIDVNTALLINNRKIKYEGDNFRLSLNRMTSAEKAEYKKRKVNVFSTSAYCSNKLNIVVHGAGACGKKFINQIQGEGVNIVAWTDINSREREDGLFLPALSACKDMKFDYWVIAVANAIDSVKLFASEIGLPCEKILTTDECLSIISHIKK